jgi:hypothetical protein
MASWRAPPAQDADAVHRLDVPGCGGFHVVLHGLLRDARFARTGGRRED